jgi:protoheme IX farnesyltransferase
VKANVESIFPSTLFTWARAADFLEMTKPRITSLVLATTAVGFYLGAQTRVSLIILGNTLLGTALVAAGASALNMWLERSRDSRMQRTVNRPLPAGRLQSREAMIFAVALSAIGIISLIVFVNALTGLLAAATLLSYVFLYTPLKTRTWLCTLVGAVPGAMPPLIGWAAATGDLSLGAWVLFAIVFFWQLPHFFAIAWIYREDYARAGFPMLAVIDGTGGRTSRQASLYLAALLIVTLIPNGIGLAGTVYLAGAILLGLSFLAFGLLFARRRDQVSARHLFIASVCYLPALLTLLIVDKIAA